MHLIMEHYPIDQYLHEANCHIKNVQYEHYYTETDRVKIYNKKYRPLIIF